MVENAKIQNSKLDILGDFLKLFWCIGWIISKPKVRNFLAAKRLVLHF